MFFSRNRLLQLIHMTILCSERLKEVFTIHEATVALQS